MSNMSPAFFSFTAAAIQGSKAIDSTFYDIFCHRLFAKNCN